MNARKLLCVFGILLPTLILPYPTYGAKKFGISLARRQLKTACQLVQDADIGWNRSLVRWNEVMDDEGNLDFETLDRRIRIILNKDINIILTLRSVHPRFAPGSGKIDLGHKKVWRSAPPHPDYLDNYSDFVEEVVERYDGDGQFDAAFITGWKNIKYWQIEVEPGKNPDKGSNFWKGTAQDYADLYLFAYPIIKNADSDASVALSAFTWASMNYYKKNGDSFPMRVLEILEGDPEGNFDIFDFHFYKGYKRFLGTDGLIDAHLDSTGFGDKPIWITETNVDKQHVDPDWTVEEYNRFVAKDIAKRYCVFFGRNIEKVFWFNLFDTLNAVWENPVEATDLQNFTGLTDKDFVPKPAYYTNKLFIEKISGKATVRRLRRLQPDAYTWIYKFGGNDHAVYVLWYDGPDGGSREVSIPLPWQEVLITQVITESGMTEPQLEVRETSNGELQIILSDSPVFLEKYPVSHCDFCDLNDDGVCNAEDLVIFGDSYGWGQSDCNEPGVECPCDIDHDGGCNGFGQDGKLFVEAYERCEGGE
jgi:hypothetical protein